MDRAISDNITHESSSFSLCLIKTWFSCESVQPSNSNNWCCQQAHSNFRITPSWGCQPFCTAGQNTQCLGYNLGLGLGFVTSPSKGPCALSPLRACTEIIFNQDYQKHTCTSFNSEYRFGNNVISDNSDPV